MLKVTLAQLNYMVGDISGNIRRMREAATRAAAEQADLVVFSELSLCGYYPGDLLDEPSFLQRLDAGLQELLQATRQLPDLHWVVGAPTRHNGPGKPLHNSLLVLKNGQIRLQYDKQLLPTYNIFDERRHFEPGPDVAKVLRIGGTQVGLLVCEDGWNDHGADYATNPFERLRDAAPDLVISINASPSHVGKREQRHQIFGGSSRRHGLPILYVNQVGGHDQVVYDGASFAAEPDAGIVFEKAPLHGVDIDLADCPDLGPVLMVLGLLCEGTTTIRNAERLRIKESDRIAAMEAELRACGGVLESEGGTITIHGCADRLHAPAAPLHGHNDHRVVMSLAVLALAAGLALPISGAEAVAKSWPDFLEAIKPLGAEVEHVG